MSLALSSLKEKGFVKDKLGRVENEIRRRKVYFLTHNGFSRAKEVKGNFLKKEIEVAKAGSTTKIRIEELDDFLEDSYFLIDVLSCINSDGVLDMTSLTGEPSGPKEGVPTVETEVETPQETIVEGYKPPNLAVSFVQVGCKRCGMPFLIQASGGLTEIYTRCPNCRETFKPFVSPTTQALTLPKKKRMKTDFFWAGITMIALVIIFPLFLGPFVSMIAWIPTIPLAVIFIAVAFEGVRTLTKLEERYLIAGTGFVMFLTVILIQVRVLADLSSLTFLVLFLMFLPFVILLAISKKKSEELMREIAITGGLTYLVLGLFAAGMPGGMAWANQLYLYLVLFGALIVLLAYHTWGLKHFTPEGMCVGVGIPIFISATSWLVSLSGSLDIISLVAASLWLVLGLILINVRLLPKNLSQRMVETFKSATPFSIGMFFIIFGILLAFAFRYVESVVPFVVGIPVVFYGIDKAARSPITDKIALFLFATILTLVTLYPIFYV